MLQTVVTQFYLWVLWLKGALKRSRSPSPPPPNYHQGYGYKPGTIPAYPQQSMYTDHLTMHYATLFMAIMCHDLAYLDTCNRRYSVFSYSVSIQMNKQNIGFNLICCIDVLLFYIVPLFTPTVICCILFHLCILPSGTVIPWVG